VKLATRLRPARNADTIPEPDPARAEHERHVREARLANARRQSAWTEIPEPRLVPRGRGLLVDAETDFVWVVRRGHVWEPHKATIGFVPDDAALTFTVNQNGGVVFLEQPGSLRSWSEYVERQARRGRAT
jgi:hypothetical protein